MRPRIVFGSDSRGDSWLISLSVTAKLGFCVTKHLDVFAAYTFTYLSSTVRPGEQINRTVNPTIVPVSHSFGMPVGPAQPSFTFQRTDFWAQGLNFGLEFSY